MLSYRHVKEYHKDQPEARPGQPEARPGQPEARPPYKGYQRPWLHTFPRRTPGSNQDQPGLDLYLGLCYSIACKGFICTWTSWASYS